MLVDHVQSVEPTKYLFGGDNYIAHNVKLMFYNIKN